MFSEKGSTDSPQGSISPESILDGIHSAIDAAKTQDEAFLAFANYVLLWVNARAVIRLSVDSRPFTTHARCDPLPELHLWSRGGAGFQMDLFADDKPWFMNPLDDLFPTSEALEAFIQRFRQLHFGRQSPDIPLNTDFSLPTGYDEWWLPRLRPLQQRLGRALDPFISSALCIGDNRTMQLWCVLRHHWLAEPRRFVDPERGILADFDYTASVLPTSEQMEEIGRHCEEAGVSGIDPSIALSAPIGPTARASADTLFESRTLYIGKPSGAEADNDSPDMLRKVEEQRKRLEYSVYRRYCGYAPDRTRIAYFPALETYGLPEGTATAPVFALYFFVTGPPSLDIAENECLATSHTKSSVARSYRFLRDTIPIVSERLRAAYEDAYITVVLDVILAKFQHMGTREALDQVNFELRLLTRLYALPQVTLQRTGNGLIEHKLSMNQFYKSADNIGDMMAFYSRLDGVIQNAILQFTSVSLRSALSGQQGISHTTQTLANLMQFNWFSSNLLEPSTGRSKYELTSRNADGMAVRQTTVESRLEAQAKRLDVFGALLAGTSDLSEAVVSPDNWRKYLCLDEGGYQLRPVVETARDAAQLHLNESLVLDGLDSLTPVVVPRGCVKGRALATVLFEFLSNAINHGLRDDEGKVNVKVHVDQNPDEIKLTLVNSTPDEEQFISLDGIHVKQSDAERNKVASRSSFLSRLHQFESTVGLRSHTAIIPGCFQISLQVRAIQNDT